MDIFRALGSGLLSVTAMLDFSGRANTSSERTTRKLLTICLLSAVIGGFCTEQNVRWPKSVMKKIGTRHILSWQASLPYILSAVGRQLR